MSTPSSITPETGPSQHALTPAAGAEDGVMDEIPRRQMRGKQIQLIITL